MNRKWALVAAPLVVLGNTAFADGNVGVYGVADLFTGAVNNKGGTLPQGTTGVVNSGGMTTSFVGIKGDAEVEPGIKVVADLESFVRLDTGAIGRNDTDPFWARLAVVGVESDAYGRVTVGRHVTPYSLAVTNFTPFVGSTTFSTAFANTFKGDIQGDTRFNNSIRYTSPGQTGLIFDGVFSFGTETAEGPSRHNGQAFDGVVRYAGDGWGAVVGTRQINLNSANNGHVQRSYMLAAQYDFKVLQLFGQLHDTSDSYDDTTQNATHRVLDVSVAVPVGAKGAVWASYGRSKIDDLIPTSPDARVSWALAYDYNIWKRTDIYAAVYSDEQKNPLVRQQIAAVGIRYKF